MSNIDVTPAGTPPPEGDTEEVPKLRRRATDRWLAGVCSGLADYFGLHPAVYRVLFVALAFAGGTGILLYVAAALVMPVEGKDESAATSFLRENRHRPWLVIAIALLALVLIAVLTDGGGDGAGLFILVLIFGAGALLWSRAARRDARRTQASGRPSRRWRVTTVLASVTIVSAAVVGAAVAADSKGGFGEHIERPTSVAQLKDEYRLTAGQIELDLRDLELPPGETRVRTEVGFGEIDVTLPPDTPAAVTARARWGGEVDVLGRGDEGRNTSARVVDAGFDDARTRLVVEAHVRAGEVTVRR